MAAVARGRELTGQVVGVSRVIVIGQVASNTLRSQARRETVGVTLRALQGGVRSGKREGGELVVVEFRAGPHVYAVAGLAGDREIRGHVVQRFGSLIVLQMAGDALRAQAGINPRRSSMMAVVASCYRMGANQWKPVAVLLNRRNGHVPAANGVAALTIRPELPAVQIRVTLRALRRSSREYQVRMTTPATDGMMQTQQRKTGLPVMIEFQLAADGFPCRSAMAILATGVELAVGIRLTAADGVLRNCRSAPQRSAQKTHDRYRTPSAPRP